MMDALKKELVLLSNKARYIKENLDGTIDLRKKKKEQVQQMLTEKGYDVIEDDAEFKYLVKMSMDSVTEENVDKLFKERGSKEEELTIIQNTTVNQMWISELDNLKEEYSEYKEVRQRLMNGEDINPKTNKKKVVSKGVIVKKNVKPANIVVEDD